MDLSTYLAGKPALKARLAVACGVTPGAVTHWANGTRKPPPKHWKTIMKFSKGKVGLRDLRPDVFDRALMAA